MSIAAIPSPIRREPELTGQTVVLIGGSAGIGFETARRARAEGADVILTGRNPDRLKQAARELGVQHTAAFDANDAPALKRFFQDLPTTIDHVMITAGGPPHTPPPPIGSSPLARATSVTAVVGVSVAVNPGG